MTYPVRKKGYLFKSETDAGRNLVSKPQLHGDMQINRNWLN